TVPATASGLNDRADPLAEVPAIDPPWGPQTPDYRFVSRNTPVQGIVRVRANPPRLKARCLSEIAVVSGRPMATMRLQVEPESGSSYHIDYFLSAPVDRKLSWTCSDPANAIAGVERVSDPQQVCAFLALGCVDPIQCAGTLALARPPRNLWRITLAHSLC